MRDIVPSKKNTIADSSNNAELKAEELNNFFVNVGKSTYEEAQDILKKETCGTYADIPCTAPTTPFRPEPVDVRTVILTIKHLQETQSFRSDKISLRFIKDSLYIIAYYLTIVSIRQ